MTANAATTEDLIGAMTFAQDAVTRLLNAPDFKTAISGTIHDLGAGDSARRQLALSALVKSWDDVVRGKLNGELGEETPDVASRRLNLLLLVWLGLFFNGTPRPNLWQEIADLLDQQGGAPSVAFVLKQYGDVFRIERRRRQGWRNGTADTRPTETAIDGIVTVVERPVSLCPGEEWRIELDGSGDLPSAHEIVDAHALPHLGGRDKCPLWELPALEMGWVTQRLSRLYMTYQVIRYLAEGYPITMLCRHDDSWGTDIPRLLPRGVRLLHGKAQRIILVSGKAGTADDRGPIAKAWGLPSCVLGAKVGVLRDHHRQLASHIGRAEFSRNHIDLRNSVLETVDSLYGLRVDPSGPGRAVQIFPPPVD